ncbi:hypothetical protein [uncultured Kiloniella sp.]|uniref:hypothetical protein n=1 Tax=uncultured Kiloniella sp. TaxID=1133091 RepID=UPI0026205277|nr:hypothetical protein [uncultured Kiloniella sp.]
MNKAPGKLLTGSIISGVIGGNFSAGMAGLDGGYRLLFAAIGGLIPILVFYFLVKEKKIFWDTMFPNYGSGANVLPLILISLTLITYLSSQLYVSSEIYREFTGNVIIYLNLKSTFCQNITDNDAVSHLGCDFFNFNQITSILISIGGIAYLLSLKEIFYQKYPMFNKKNESKKTTISRLILLLVSISLIAYFQNFIDENSYYINKNYSQAVIINAFSSLGYYPFMLLILTLSHRLKLLLFGETQP